MATVGGVALRDLADLHMQRYPHDFLLPRVWALRNKITAYDAVYKDFAEALDGAWRAAAYLGGPSQRMMSPASTL